MQPKHNLFWRAHALCNGPAPTILAFFFNAAIDAEVERRLKTNRTWAETEAKNKVFELDQSADSKIGNRRGAAIPIRDQGISWSHALIQFADGAFKIRDDGSKKGTTVDGNTLSKSFVTLKGGETIDFGGVVEARFLTDDMPDDADGAAGGGNSAELQARVDELEGKLKKSQ